MVFVYVGGNIKEAGEHKPGCYLKSGRELPPGLKGSVPVVGGNFFDEMHADVKQIAEETTDLPEAVWMAISNKYRTIVGPNYRGMRKDQVKALVKDVRRSKIGGDVIQQVESEYCGSKSEAFVRMSSIFSDENGLQRIMCFCRASLVHYLEYPQVS